MHAWRPPRAARWPSAPTATAPSSQSDARLEAAARRALAIGANSYRSIESILNHRLDEHPPEPIEPAAPIEHHNIRGSDYYS